MATFEAESADSSEDCVESSTSVSSSEDSDWSDVQSAIVACATALLLPKKQKRRKKRVWVRSWLSKRPHLGAYSQLLQELVRDDDSRETQRFLRMTSDSFEEILSMVRPRITKQDTDMRKAIEAGERLAITLRYLGSGDTYISLSYLFRVGDNTIRKIVLETCSAIYEELKDKYLKVPSTTSEWLGLADRFERRWQFPNCLGAIDGKHIHIRSPGRGSDYFNYERYHSIILLALVDADYCITWFDIGTNGRAGDAAVFNQSSLAEQLEDKENLLHFPSPTPLPGRSEAVPYVIVGDDAFGLKPYLMKPFPFRNTTTSQGNPSDPDEVDRKKQRIFDYRLSRARRLSENVFGILAAKFGIFQRAMRHSPEDATTVTLACLALHNFLMKKNDKSFAPAVLMDRENPVTHESIDGEWRVNHQSCFGALARQAGNRNSADARWVRNELKEYMSSEGAVPWQNRITFGGDFDL